MSTALKLPNAFQATGPTRGFSLIEVTFAIGICTFLLTALFGLLQACLLQHRTSVEESLAINLSQMVISDLKQAARDVNLQTTHTLQYGLPIAPGSEGEVFLTDSGAVAPSANVARFRVVTRIATSENTDNKGRRSAISFWPPNAPAQIPYAEVVAALKL